MYFVNESNGIYTISSNGRVISFSSEKNLQESVAKELNKTLEGENERTKKTKEPKRG